MLEVIMNQDKLDLKQAMINGIEAEKGGEIVGVVSDIGMLTEQRR